LRRQDRLDDDHRLRLRQFEHGDAAGEWNLEHARLVFEQAAVGESDDHRPRQDPHDVEESDRVMRLRSLHQPEQSVPGDPPAQEAVAFLRAGPIMASLGIFPTEAEGGLCRSRTGANPSRPRLCRLKQVAQVRAGRADTKGG
jgi:hypothetical protein